MRSVKHGLLKTNIDINLVCSIIDEGLVWGINPFPFETKLMKQGSEYTSKKYFEKPEKIIENNQANFLSFLNVESLLSQLISRDIVSDEKD
jgi:hypothetical protein